METNSQKLKKIICDKKEDEFLEVLRSGLDPNFEGGWPIRLAARFGCTTIVEKLLQFGANPHLLSNSGASTLQLAVFSGEHWNSNKWTPLLSCCDSSQLADGAAVAIIFNNVAALRSILGTGRCNTNIPTTLTGKTVEMLAKGYKLSHLMNSPIIQNYHEHTSTMSPRISRQTRTDPALLSPYHSQRNLSPSVARFFHQTSSQSSLSPSRRGIVTTSSPSSNDNC
ncbi:uncharacterized protein LOC113501085 [Trichoplusia ni]|uniref:Uncharacterized protein LOC113501085 n=1 Tax=Trichoplusia ni TaxID=7111 RepID=A0A7E5WCL1_TRINI|nr:uncharacterized protein LOC113501085 [Trichoplusia ni]